MKPFNDNVHVFFKFLNNREPVVPKKFIILKLILDYVFALKNVVLDILNNVMDVPTDFYSFVDVDLHVGQECPILLFWLVVVKKIHHLEGV